MAATVVGQTTASAAGAGHITFQIGPTTDALGSADLIRRNLALSNGADLEGVTVENGVASIDFIHAPAGAMVKASLSDDTVAALRMGGASGAAAGDSTAAYVGAGAALVTGGVLGGLAAAGKFDGTDVHETSTGLK
jgi:hypothetical protein